MIKIIKFIAIAGLANPAISQSILHQSTEQLIPFQLIENSGNRPNVNGTINGFPMTFDVHSNAGFYMQISHKAADAGKVAARVHVGSYGITAPGKVSPLGRDSAFVNELIVGKAHFQKAPVSIFETPADYNHGMLGLRWLTANQAVVNYEGKTIMLNPRDELLQARKKALLESGYVALPMRRSSKDGRYFIMVTINGVSQPIIVSTVADNTFDTEFAKRAKLELVKTDETYGGPTGTTGNVYKLKGPITLRVDKVVLLIKQANVEDIYAYAAEKRPTEQSAETAGMLAADFLIDNGAVVDFGAQTLYIKPVH